MKSEVVERVSEPIRVLASFSESAIKIHFFHWRERIYKIEKMSLFHLEKDGDHKIYHFSVYVKGNSYDLTYNPINLEWRLEDVVSL